MGQRVLLRFCGVWGKRHIACMNSSVKTMLGEEEVIWKIFQVSKFPHSLAPGICPFSITSGNTVPAVHTHSWLLFCPVEHQQTFTKSTLAPFGVCVSNLPSWWDLFPSHLSPHQDLLCASSQHHTGLLSMDCLYWPQIIPSLCLPPILYPLPSPFIANCCHSDARWWAATLFLITPNDAGHQPYSSLFLGQNRLNLS